MTILWVFTSAISPRILNFIRPRLTGNTVLIFQARTLVIHLLSISCAPL